MNVLIVTRHDLFPSDHGASVKIINTASYLSTLGPSVFIVTGDNRFYYEYRFGYLIKREFPSYLRGFHSLFHTKRRSILSRILPDGFDETIHSLLKMVGYPEEEHLLYQPLVDLNFWARCVYLGRKYRIDIYQAEFPGFVLPSYISKLLNGGKVVVVEHNIEYMRMRDTAFISQKREERLKAIELALLKLADDVVTVSRIDKDILVQDGIDPEKITVIPHGVNLKDYRNIGPHNIRERYGIPMGLPLLFFHGTLHYTPNSRAIGFIVDELLPRFRAKGIDIRIMICGKNPPDYYNEVEIVFTGSVPDLPQHISAADVAIVPILEGGGTRMKILEYLAAGIPVVSTRKGAEGIPLKEDIEILLADDWDEFAGKVENLIHDPCLKEKLIINGREFVHFYDWTDICHQYLALFQGYMRGSDFNEILREKRERAKRFDKPAEGLGDRVDSKTSSSITGLIEAEKDQKKVIELLIEDPLIKNLPSLRYKPLTLLFLLNRRCNLRCLFCDLYKGGGEIPVEKGRDILRQARGIGTEAVVFTGGEPLLYRGLIELVKEAKSLGMGVNVTTNGTMVQRFLKEFKESGVDSVSISIDARGELHDRLRGRKGVYEKAISSVKALKDWGFIVNIYTVVTEENTGEIIPLFDMAERMNCGFDFWPVNNFKDYYMKSEESFRRYREACLYIAERSPSFKERLPYYLKGIDFHRGTIKRVRCHGFIRQFGVNPEGDVLPCCQWGVGSLKGGNLFEKSLADIFESSKIKDIRRKILLQGCSECFNHSLYEFTKITGLDFELPLKQGVEG